eukprot:scaffold99220_cov57-Phaeocystis_antarctica.AAC.2
MEKKIRHLLTGCCQAPKPTAALSTAALSVCALTAQLTRATVDSTFTVADGEGGWNGRSRLSTEAKGPARLLALAQRRRSPVASRPAQPPRSAQQARRFPTGAATPAPARPPPGRRRRRRRRRVRRSRRRRRRA